MKLMRVREAGLREFLLPKLRVITQFLASQGLTAAGNVLYGLLCVRLLPPSDYAKFVTVFGVQGTLVVLMDLGVNNSLIPLIGERVANTRLIADYVASYRRIARVLYFVMAAGLCFFYPVLVRGRGWNWQLIAGMIGVLLTSTWFIRMNAAYGAVLLMLRDRTQWYRAQIHASLGTLALLIVLWAAHWLTAFAAIALNVSGLVYCGVYYYFRSRTLLQHPGTADPAKVKAILRLSLPNAPMSLFNAIQGQLPLFLIIFFGRAIGIASVGALGRLSQIFVLLSQVNLILVEPFFSKLPKARFRKSYFVALLLATSLCVAVSLVAAAFPGAFLFFLGPAYRGLEVEAVLAVVAGGLSCLNSLLWTMHCARLFVYWWTNAVLIAMVFVIQVLFVTHADVSSVRTVLWMNLAANAAGVVGNGLTGVYGFLRGPRKGLQEPPPDLHPTGVLDPDVGGPTWEAEHPHAAEATLTKP